MAFRRPTNKPLLRFITELRLLGVIIARLIISRMEIARVGIACVIIIRVIIIRVVIAYVIIIRVVIALVMILRVILKISFASASALKQPSLFANRGQTERESPQLMRLRESFLSRPLYP